MFIVAPSGRTNPATLGETPSCSREIWMVVGRVALLELVENAVTHGISNMLEGGTGNDSLYVVSGISNNLRGGDGNDWLGVNGGSHRLYGGNGSDWMGATGEITDLYGEGGDDTMDAARMARFHRFGLSAVLWTALGRFVHAVRAHRPRNVEEKIATTR